MCLNGGMFTKSGTGGVVYGSDAAAELRNSAPRNGDAVFRASSRRRNSTIPAGMVFDSSVDVGWGSSGIPLRGMPFKNA